MLDKPEQPAFIYLQPWPCVLQYNLILPGITIDLHKLGQSYTRWGFTSFASDASYKWSRQATSNNWQLVWELPRSLSFDNLLNYLQNSPKKLNFKKVFSLLPCCMNALLPVCMYTMYVPGAHKGQKKPLHLSELELWMLLSCLLVLGFKTSILCKNKCF